MKKSEFTDAQIAFVLRPAEDGTAIGEVCRKAGISEAMFYNWRKKYGGLMPSEMQRLKQLGEGWFVVADATAASSRRPSVSTSAWRLRPTTRCAAS